MSHNLGFLDDESLTDNLSDEIAKKLLEWLEYLALNESPDFDKMLQFTKGFNKAKVVPLSHKGIYLNNIFEITLVYVSKDANILIRFAKHLIDQGAVYVPQKVQEE